MTSHHTVDILLDERARLIAQRVSVEADLWAAGFLLHRVGKLLPHLIADSPHNAVHRETLMEEVREFLETPRLNPKLPDGGVDDLGEADSTPPSGSGDVDV